MINKIKYTEALKPFITHECEENKISASKADDIPCDNYLVIKVDDYYNSLKRSDTPLSIDCLIPLRCIDKRYIIYLIELKDTKATRFTVDEIYGKFKTTIEDFMSRRFKTIFLNKRFEIKRLRLYFVTKHYKSYRSDSTKMDFLLSKKPFKFRGRKYQFERKMPEPLIKNC